MLQLPTTNLYTTFRLEHLRILTYVFKTGDPELGLTSPCITTVFEDIHLSKVKLK